MVINLLHLGRIEYAVALRLQETLVSLRKQGRIGDTILLLEHPPVITIGRSSRRSHILLSQDELASRGVELFESDRGGDVTFHGPGQLVGYPILDLRGFTPKLGVVDFVRKLEEALMRACGDHGVVTQRVPGLTGVWTQADNPAKICAIGIHVSRGVTSHGFGLNVATDLDYFRLIVPCGICDRPITSLERELHSLNRTLPTIYQVASSVSRHFGWVFGAQMLWLESLDSLFSEAPRDLPARVPKEFREFHGEEERFLS